MNIDTLIIINPHSGLLNPMNSGAAEIAHHAMTILPGALVVETESEEHAAEEADRAIRSGATTIAAAGGDGTAKFLAGLLIGKDVRMGLIPCGSAGNVASCLGIPGSVRRALKIIKKGRSTKLDVGRVGDALFLEAAGSGFHADVLRKYSRRSTKSLARSVYSLSRALIDGKPFDARIEADGKVAEFRAAQITVSNLPLYGTGFRMAPEASFSDGLLDVTIIGETPPWQLPALAVAARSGALSLMPGVSKMRGAIIKITADPPAPVHADAENAGMTPAVFTVSRGALNVIVP